jgi:mannose-6-phosphate isomerase-like protein (cupin superfamily)
MVSKLNASLRSNRSGMWIRFGLFVAACLMTMALRSSAADTPAVTYVDHDKVAVSLTKGGNLVKADDLTVLGSHRGAGSPPAEVHDKETDVMYVTDGEATIVTGGTLLESKVTRPGQLIGSGIQGGETHHLSKGDVIVIPAGIPHWFKEIPQSINYYVVKVLKP